MLRQFRKLVEDELDACGPYAAKLAAHPGAAAVPSAKLAALRKVMLLAVGPEEGGWTPFELELLAAHGFEAVSWGPRCGPRYGVRGAAGAGACGDRQAAGSQTETSGGAGSVLPE